METVIDFIFLGSEITADGNCSHEIKMLARKPVTEGQILHDSTLVSKIDKFIEGKIDWHLPEAGRRRK